MGRPRKIRVPSDQLGQEVHAALNEYAKDSLDVVRELSQKYAKEGAKAVKSAARSTFDGTGEYASGWTSRYETGRYSAQGIIYNAKEPGLPHLLEHGHVTRNGTGRTFAPTPGRKHIEPVEQEITEKFEKAVKAEL